MRLLLLDGEHGRDERGTLYVRVDGRWRPGAASSFDAFFRSGGYADGDVTRALDDFLLARARA